MTQEIVEKNQLREKEAINFFQNDDLRTRCFLDKYALKNDQGLLLEGTPVDMWKRVSKAMASPEENEGKRQEWERKFYWLLEDFKFVPGGRIMFGAGYKKRRRTLLNCYVIPVKGDSIENIWNCSKEMARTYSYGGGVGTDISILRPKGSPTNNSSLFSTGSVSFMELFSLTTGTIGQNGRRGALMITIDVDHPDILDFIDIKNDPERRRVKYANISIKISDEFMKAVENDEEFTLKYRNEVIGEVKTKVNAGEVWRKLIKNARDSAEPGLIFWSNIKRESTTEYNGMEVVTTNPCVSGDTRLHTENGLITAKELYEQGLPIKATIDHRTEFSDTFGTEVAICTPMFRTSNNAKVYKVKTDSGYEIKATDWHEFYVAKPKKVYYEDGKKVNRIKHEIVKKRLKDVKEGELLLIQSGEGNFGKNGSYELGLITGLIAGDGTFDQKRAMVDLWNETGEIISEVRTAVEKIIEEEYTSLDISPEWINRSINVGAMQQVQKGKVRMQSQRLGRILKEKYNFSKVTKFQVPEMVWQGSKECMVGYLKGLFSADGTIWTRDRKNDEIYIGLTSVNNKFLKEIQILLSNFGIFSRIYNNLPSDRSKFSYVTKNGEIKEYYSKSGCSLRIHGDNVRKFVSCIGFLQKEKSEKFHRWLIERKSKPSRKPEKFVTSIKSIKCVGEEPVYDTTQLYNHSLIFNGIVTGNCSEIPLEPYGCCCLGNINLAAFVKDEYSGEAQVDWPSLEKAARYSTRFLDNVLAYSADLHALEEQKKASLWSRRIGVGFTGFGDMLIKLGLKYDNEAAIEFTDDLFGKIKNIVHDESVNLAIEKGIFPAFDLDKHLKSPFIQRLDKEVIARIKKHGIRNAALLTVPPVGSGSILAGTTSGIEPIFALSYTRRTESLSKNEFVVYHPSVRQYMEKFNIDDEKDLPETFITSHQIKPEFRVKMQATIQKHIDHSISSTVNLHSDISEEEVDKIYFLAWKLGCKGMTVYREGSREGVLITKEESEKSKKTEVKEIAQANVERPRPSIVTGKTHRIQTGYGNMYVTVNSDEIGQPFEVFTQIGKTGGFTNSFTEAIGRLISLSLRSGIDAQAVIEQLRGIRSPLISWDNGNKIYSVPDGISLALQREISGECREIQTSLTEASKKKPELHVIVENGNSPECPECNAMLEYSNGCVHCAMCGWSQCD